MELNSQMQLEELREFENGFYKPHQGKTEQKRNLTEEEINDKYLKGEVRIVTEQARYPLPTISEMFSSDNYILRPEFQRRHRWDVKKQSRLIESFIMNVPIPPIFLYEKDFSVYEVMDGLQRVTAIMEFYQDKYVLEGLEQWEELNGKKYSQLPEQIKKGIDRRYISSIILLKETAKNEDEANRMKQMVFSRINSGGAKLEDQEYRNSQYASAFNNMIIELARNLYFCEIFDIPQRTEDEDIFGDNISNDLKENQLFSKMKDVEYVLRFFAMRNIQAWNKGTLSKFLDQVLQDSRNLPDSIISVYHELFVETIKLAYDIYGEKVFRLRKKAIIDDAGTGEEVYIWRWNSTPNLVVYDPVMVALSNNIEHMAELLAKKDEILGRTQYLLEQYEGMWNGRNTAKANVEERIEAFDRLFKGVL